MIEERVVSPQLVETAAGSRPVKMSATMSIYAIGAGYCMVVKSLYG